MASALWDLLHEGRVERQIRLRLVLYLPGDPAPSAINPVVHDICGILTGLLWDVTGDLNSNFTVAFNGE